MIELTKMIISSPKKFDNVLFTFNNKADHQFDDRLKRGLSCQRANIGKLYIQ